MALCGRGDAASGQLGRGAGGWRPDAGNPESYFDNLGSSSCGAILSILSYSAILGTLKMRIIAPSGHEVCSANRYLFATAKRTLK